MLLKFFELEARFPRDVSELPAAAVRYVAEQLTERAAVRFLRAVEARHSPRDKAIALIPFYAGARIAEVVSLDVDDVQLSARKGIMRIYGKGEKVREIPIHPQLRTALTGWLDERPGWPGADSPALFLNQRGSRLSAKGAHDIITSIAATAGLDDDTTTHVYADPVVMPRLARKLARCDTAAGIGSARWPPRARLGQGRKIDCRCRRCVRGCANPGPAAVA